MGESVYIHIQFANQYLYHFTVIIYFMHMFCVREYTLLMNVWYLPFQRLYKSEVPPSTPEVLIDAPFYMTAAENQNYKK